MEIRNALPVLLLLFIYQLPVRKTAITVFGRSPARSISSSQTTSELSWNNEDQHAVFESSFATFDDRHFYQVCSNKMEKWELRCSLYLWLPASKRVQNASLRRCDLAIRKKTNPDEKLVASSIKRLSKNVVVLEWSKTKGTRLIEKVVGLVDTRDCTVKYSNVGDGIDPVGGFRNPSHINEAVVYKDGSFDLIQMSKLKLVTSYNFEGEVYDYRYLPAELDVGVDVKIDAVDRNLFLRSRNSVTGDYDLVVVTSNGQVTNLPIDYPIAEGVIVSIEDTSIEKYYLICGVDGRGENSTDVRCFKFEKSGFLEEKFKIEVSGMVKLIGARLYLNDVILLTRKFNCTTEQCLRDMTLSRSLSSDSGKTESIEQRFECLHEDEIKWDILYDKYRRRYVVTYVCEQVDKDDPNKSGFKVEEFSWNLKDTFDVA